MSPTLQLYYKLITACRMQTRTHPYLTTNTKNLYFNTEFIIPEIPITDSIYAALSKVLPIIDDNPYTI